MKHAMKSLVFLAILALATGTVRGTTGELLARYMSDTLPAQYLVTDASITAGLPAGAAAVLVPKGGELELDIPSQLREASGHPYTLVLKIKITSPLSDEWVSLVNMPDNNSDEMIYLHKDTRKVCIKQFNKNSVSATSSRAVQLNTWTVLAFAFGTNTTEIYMDGELVFSGTGALAGSNADCYYAANRQILVGADNDGEDNPFYLADARIYDGAVAVADELPGTGVDGDPFRIASAADWALFASNVNRGMALGDDYPYYRLDASIGSAAAPITQTVGTDAHHFRGNFDGGSNTIHVALSGSTQGTALFSRTDKVNIHDIKVTGSVSSTANHAAGLLGICCSTTIVQCCDVSTDVAVTGAGYAGGIIGHAGANHLLILYESIFSGTISGFTAYAGGLIGWCDSLTELHVTQDLFKGAFSPGASAKLHPIACKNDTSALAVHMYGDNIYYLNTVTPTVEFNNRIIDGRPVSATRVPDLWEEQVTAIDGNVYYAQSAIILNSQTGYLLLRSGDVLTGTGGPGTNVMVEDGATVTLYDVNITGISTNHQWGGVTCKGDATIILQGANVLRGGHPWIPGLAAATHSNSTLVILGNGSLDAGSNGYGAGIGGGARSLLVCGNIVIAGGTITATGGNGAAGIGSGQDSSCGTITISGGTITATGGDAAAGIGTGMNAIGGAITVSGGTVIATGGKAAAGIGCGMQATNDTITVSGGTVTTTGGAWAAGIGGSLTSLCGDIILSGGSITARGNQYGSGVGNGLSAVCGDITVSGADVIAVGGSFGPGIGAGQQSSCGDILISDGTVDATGGAAAAGIGIGFHATCGDILVSGGDVTATGGENGAGIGAAKETGCGNITISGGTVNAMGGNGGAAGIGTGREKSSCGIITISGGEVTAEGGDSMAAGIGSGYLSVNGAIVISGGDVTATGSPGGAGIGAGYEADCADITISGGIVIATGSRYAAGIGGGANSTNDTITVSGGTVYATGDLYGAGIGGGVNGVCGDIVLEDGVILVTATHGDNCSNSVGKGAGSGSCGSVTVGGVETGNITENPYIYNPCITTIASTADWDAFASRVNRGVDSYDGKTVTLAADVAATTMVGTSDHPFCGTFNGGGHTLAAAIVSAEQCAALFRQIDGATISNLTVTGTVAGSAAHAAGLVGACGATRPNILRDCTVAVAVSGTGYAGGIVGHGGDGTLTFEGCVFRGSVGGFNAFAGGLMGWSNTLTLNIANCLSAGSFTPADGGTYHPIACKFASRTVTAYSVGTYYLNTAVPTATGGNLVVGALGEPVSATRIDCEWTVPVTAADGHVYYRWSADLAGGLTYYAPADGSMKSCPGGVERVGLPTLADGWYVVAPGMTLVDDRIIVSGRVNLLLCDGAALFANSGITVAEGASLAIWGQGGEHAVPGTAVTTRGTGTLYAQTPGSGTYSQAAAIGGENQGTTGDIVVNGGVVTARGTWGAGIGRGNVASGAVGSVAIHGGHVDASGSRGSAGIGSGAYADSCPVTITGGYVLAVGCVYDATGQATPGIGTGRPRTNGSQPLSNGTITITGGTVVAQAGTAPSGGTAAQAIGVNSVDAAHNGTGHLVLGEVRAYASASATAPVAASARGDTCRGAWVKLEVCPHEYENSVCRWCGKADETTGYAAWATDNGVTGAWNATDALGIPNVFRFAFDKPSGAFADPPLLSISFNATGNPVILTPPLVNGDGFDFAILATDTLDGDNPATYPLAPSGTNAIPATASPSRFFRLKAAEQ